MIRFHSLSLRLVVYLFIAQMAALLLLIPATDFIISISGVSAAWEISADDWGKYRIQALLSESIARTPQGEVVLRLTPALRAYLDANPQVRYAAYDSHQKRALPGSCPELADALGEFDTVEASSAKFRIRGDANPRARGALAQIGTPFGDYVVAAYGYRIAWNDLIFIAGLFMTLHTAIVVVPAILFALAIGVLVVRGGLAPLRAASAEVAEIDMNTLHQRIVVNDAPAEIAPFIDAVNGVLTRLDAGVEAQRRFTANAAHELRTPIAIMRAHADNPDDAAFRRDMRRDIRRIQTIAEQVLATARSAEQGSHGAESFELGATVLEMVADYAPLMIENKTRLEYEAPAEAAYICGDRWAIECVLANLLDNALRAEPVGGCVLARVTLEGVVDIEDHGAGVDAADRDAIFEPFWRKGAKSKGVGLGLAISKNLVQRLGGTLSVADTPGGGATFRLDLRQSLIPAPIS